MPPLTSYTTSKTAPGSPPPRAGIGLTSVTATFDVTVALADQNYIKMVKVPKGATIIDMILSTSDLDTGAALTLSVGDLTGVGQYLVTPTAIGQTGGVQRMTRNAAHGYTYLVEDVIAVACVGTPGGGGIGGTITLTAIYQMQQ